MTIQELRVFLQEWFCGCGAPEEAAARRRDILALHPLYEHRADLEALIPDSGVALLVLYTLDHFGLTEHGGTVGGAWLSDKGKAVLAALRAHDLETLMVMACVHGYDVNEHCPHCAEGQ